VISVVRGFLFDCPVRASCPCDARLQLERIGVKLTRLTKKQADYLGVPPEGPYKPEHYCC
jgi:hypothetical protein